MFRPRLFDNSLSRGKLQMVRLETNPEFDVRQWISSEDDKFICRINIIYIGKLMSLITSTHLSGSENLTRNWLTPIKGWKKIQINYFFNWINNILIIQFHLKNAWVVMVKRIRILFSWKFRLFLWWWSIGWITKCYYCIMYF